jgi:hypothetical protein
MGDLKGKVQNALDEARTLVLGSQILLGFQYEAIFQRGFDGLPPDARLLKLVGLGLMVIAMILLMAPAPFHRLVEDESDSRKLIRYTTRCVQWALLPFAVGFGIDFYVVFERLAGFIAGLAAGGGILLVALFFWYGMELIRNMEGKGRPEPADESDRREPTPVGEKVKHVLTEARVVLPGAQALLGFQFIAMITEQFDALPEATKYVHAASLAAVALSTILLMTPAAYHRLVEKGEDNERFHRLAGRFVLVAMAPLAIGVSGDIYVVVRKVLDSDMLAASLAGAMLLLFLLFWFALPLYVRRSQ